LGLCPLCCQGNERRLGIVRGEAAETTTRGKRKSNFDAAKALKIPKQPKDGFGSSRACIRRVHSKNPKRDYTEGKLWPGSPQREKKDFGGVENPIAVGKCRGGTRIHKTAKRALIYLNEKTEGSTTGGGYFSEVVWGAAEPLHRGQREGEERKGWKRTTENLNRKKEKFLRGGKRFLWGSRGETSTKGA